MSVLTPYYRNTVDMPAHRAVAEPQNNYTPYQVFVLMSRLQYAHPEHILQPISIPRDERMVLTLRVFSGNNEAKLTPEEQQLYEAQVQQVLTEYPQHCLFFSGRGPFPRPYPVNWTMSILPYLELPEAYDPFIQDGVIYLNLSQEDDFRTVYDTLFVQILERLQTLYETGAVITDAAFARTWGWIPYELIGQRTTLTIQPQDYTYDRGLYGVGWSNTKLSRDPVDFFYDRAAGRTLKVHIGDNLVVRYYVARAAPEVVFGGRWAFLPELASIQEVFSWVSVIDEARRQASGQVVALPLADGRTQGTLTERARTLYPEAVPIIYRTQDRLLPYLFSFPLPPTAEPTVVLQQLTAAR